MAPNFEYHNLLSRLKLTLPTGAKYSSSKDKVEFTTSNKTIFLNDVRCAYTHLLIRVSRDAACMNKDYLRAYDNLAEELLSAVNAYRTIRDEIPKQFPKLSEEGGKNAEI
ncbi:hypothetical protein C8R42DRAFT_644333, partial [Lentinula raphanica]